MFFELSTIILYLISAGIFLICSLFFVESTSYQKGYNEGREGVYSLGSSLGYATCLDELKSKGVINIDENGKITGNSKNNKK